MLVGFVLVGSSVLIGSVGAQTAKAPESSDRVDELLVRYNLHPAFEKLGRGMANFVGGWLEVPLNIQRRYSQNDTAASLFTGAALGLTKGIARTGVGLYETLTFWLPYPEDYAPILPTLEYFKRGEKRQEPLLLE